MPHFHIDYSPNLEERMDIAAFCETVRLAAIDTGLFPLAGIRIRALRADHVVMADGNPDHAYLDLSIRLRAGRAQDDKEKATALIFAAAEEFCADVLANSSFMLSLEMRDIDPALSPKTSSIRRYIAGAPS
ncbi:5-carboxymethyl-2-hydroxymuconate isomerase [Sulfitobacter aestuariivivens]|uniref:5-carboxymethyl-2-hydroxymuconate isomerase n=1 Tax=Sulfitobacter aestuariivivens TaxID=2766981 RepID=A0A927D418_9RHOB|nr:5-carboxymethyl-2-hydroxymuconate isomerase [Sulfitobacter aestuariivivens]MBD3662847.1 5-carboxymethyl-2-hydroxymuconate isomerase [Sulfitobacter aestuariivivens]